ncbi:MAG: hypothetical protein NXH70_12380 [Hyphomonas sp.]|nr:hypothetical protein [Hyphomonas sp.]
MSALCGYVSIVPAVATFTVATAASFAIGIAVMRYGILDEPDGERKTQATPVARLGGVAIFGAFVITNIVLGLGWIFGPCYSTLAFPLTGAFGFTEVGTVMVLLLALSAFSIGLADDILTLSSRIKLVLLALLASTVVYFGLAPSVFALPWMAIENPIFLALGSFLWIVVLTNAVNFMDGSDGLAVGSISIMFTGLAVISYASPNDLLYTGRDHPTFDLAWLVLLGAILGFLIHNLRGKLYAGDAGSLGLGALFAGVSVASGLNIWTVATLALPFLVDVLMTLIWRAKHGRNWLEPHLDHAYQRLIASGWSHLDVAILYWGFSAVSGAAAYIAAKGGGAAPFAVFWGLCLAGIALWIRHRRAAE